MTTDEARKFFVDGLVRCWPKMAHLDGREVDLFCSRLRPFTVAQAEAGLRYLLAGPNRRFRPDVATLLEAITKTSGTGRDPVWLLANRPKAADEPRGEPSCPAEHAAFLAFLKGLSGHQDRLVELSGYELIARAAARQLDPNGLYSRELLEKTLAAASRLGSDWAAKVARAIQVGLKATPPADAFVIAPLANLLTIKVPRQTAAAAESASQ